MKLGKNVFVILMAMSFLPFMAFAGEETLAEWKFIGATTPMGIGMYVHEAVGAKAQRSVDSTAVSPSGTGAYVIEIIQRSEKGANSDIQLEFKLNKLLLASKKYKIMATCKASALVSVWYTAMYALNPWPSLSKESARKCEVKTDWEVFELTFSPEKDVPAEAIINTPRFYLGSLPEGTKFYISEIRFVEIRD